MAADLGVASAQAGDSALFRDKQVIPFFPTLVWSHDLKPEIFEPLNRKLLAKLEAMLSPRPAILPNQTWQTDQQLHRLPEFQELVGIINTAVTGVLEFLQVEFQAFEITGCWANVNPKGSPHAAHTHPNNYLSGVYYLKTDQGADSISFYDPRPVTNVISPQIKQPNDHNMRKLECRVPVGRLVIFPAWFKHGVDRNLSEEERVSVSFNIMFASFAETMSRPKWSGIAVPEAGEDMR